MHMEATPSPLSLGAKPRDLRFYRLVRLVLQMFFDRVMMRVDVKVGCASGAQTMLGKSVPQPFRLHSLAVGPFEKLRAGSTGLKSRPLPRKTFPRRQKVT